MNASERYWTLDAMRGLAAICVMILHFHTDAPIQIKSGFLAVDMFFIISGFVIAGAYGDRFAQGMGIRAFTERRIVRLYPMCFLGALLGVLFHGGGLNTLLLIPSIQSPFSLYPANPALWSLTFELIINLAFAATALWLTDRRLIAIVGCSGIWLAYGLWSHGSAESLGGQWDAVMYGFPRTVFSFGLGVLFFRWQRARNITARKSRLAWLLLPATFGALAFWQVDRAPYEALAIFGILPAIVWLGTIWHLPAPRTAEFLGNVSYPLYCIHMPFVSLFPSAMKQGWSPYLIAIGVAWALDRSVDPAARNWLSRKLKERAERERARLAARA